MEKGIFLAIAFVLANTVSVAASDGVHAISDTLLHDLNRWLDAETEFTRRNSAPKIAFIEDDRAEKLRGVPGRSSGKTRGLYDEATETILLAKPWSPEDPHDISVLLHELVHHRQASRHWYCPQAQEWRAYQIQSQWLAEQNIQDDFYWPAILLHSSCVRRDIHPD